MPPFDGSGNFNLPYDWNVDKTNGVPITASRMQNQELDIATNGLSLVITRGGQSPATANLPMGGFAHTGVANATLANQYSAVGQVQNSAFTFGVAGGAADVITAVFAPANTALTNGMLLMINATAANATTTPTFSPDGLTAHTITKVGGTALAAGDIAGVGHRLQLSYSTTGTRWELLNPAKANSFSGILAPANGGSGVANSKNLTWNASLTLNGTDATTHTFPTTNSTLARTDTTQTFTGAQTFAALIDISGAAAGQIKFPATQNGSSNANTLDDYEWGTWTPAITIGGSSVGITYTSQVGSYVKTGRDVSLATRLILSSRGGLTGAVIMTGSPFSHNALNLTTPGVVVNLVPGASPIPLVMIMNNTSNTSFDFFNQTTAAAATQTAFADNSVIASQLTFQSVG